MPSLPPNLAQQVTIALVEDIGSGDVTAELVPADQRVTGKVISREPAILCGRPWVTEVFRQLDPSVHLTWTVDDGDRVAANQTLFEIAGLARPVLTGERAALNFLQLLSGTATATRRYVEAIAGTASVILDTRKTLPGLRTAQKYAVLCGGAQNLRIGLYDQVLIKENHIAAAGSLTEAIRAARRAAGSKKVEVEVETLQEFSEALTGHHHAGRIQPERHESRRRAEPCQRPQCQNRSIRTRNAGDSPRHRGNRRRLHLYRQHHETRPGGGLVNAPGVCSPLES